jgi:hypothetical protein
MLIPMHNFSAPTENHPSIAHGSLNSIQKMILPFKKPISQSSSGSREEGLGEADDFPIAVSVFQMGSSVHHPLGQATYFQTGAPGSRQE